MDVASNRKRIMSGKFDSEYSQELKDNVIGRVLNGGEMIKHVAAEQGVPDSTLRRWCREARKKQGVAADTLSEMTIVPSSLQAGATLADRMSEFAQKHDNSTIIPNTVKEIIKKWLSKDTVVWAYDTDMQIQCGIKSITQWKRYARENSEFEHLTFKLPGSSKVIWVRSEEERDDLQRRALR